MFSYITNSYIHLYSIIVKKLTYIFVINHTIMLYVHYDRNLQNISNKSYFNINEIKITTYLTMKQN